MRATDTREVNSTPKVAHDGQSESLTQHGGLIYLFIAPTVEPDHDRGVVSTLQHKGYQLQLLSLRSLSSSYQGRVDVNEEAVLRDVILAGRSRQVANLEHAVLAAYRKSRCDGRHMPASISGGNENDSDSHSGALPEGRQGQRP